jgi:hypothetical protein
MVLFVELGVLDVVTPVPHYIPESTVICLVIHNSLLSDLVPILVLILPIAKRIGLFTRRSPEWRLTKLINRNRWPHLLED